MNRIWLMTVVLGISPPAVAQKTRPGPPAGPAPAAPAAAVPATPTQAAAPTQTGAPQGEAPNVKVERGAGGKKIYKITTEIRIEGKIQKPEAFYVLQKSAINYEWTELRQDFLPKIVDSVAKAPF